MTKVQSINVKYDGYKFNITEKSPLFSEAKVYVLYHGENRNNSHISKENVDRAINTIYNIPIVGEFIEDDDGGDDNNFGGHGGKLIIDDNGSKFIQTTKPIGVVPESANVYWEVVKDEKDRDREYLVVEGALLWNRYEDAVSTLKSANFGQSMEIEVEEGFFDDESGLYHIKDFSFSAFCVLGIDDRKNGKVEPAFEDSKIITYSKRFSNELKEMKDELSEYLVSYSKKKEVKTLGKDNKEKKFDLESAKKAVEKAEESKKVTDVDKARELVSELEDGEEKDNLVARLDAIEVEEEVDEVDGEEFETDKKDEELEVEPETIETETSGIAGDPALTEEEAEKNQGTSGEINDGGDTKADNESDARAIADANTEKDYALEYKNLKAEYEEVKLELENLKEFKKAVEKEEHEKKSIELFDKLGLGEEDVKDLDIYEYTLEELEERCYSILGRKVTNNETSEFSLKEEAKIVTNKVDLSRASKESKTSRYGNLFDKFSTK